MRTRALPAVVLKPHGLVSASGALLDIKILCYTVSVAHSLRGVTLHKSLLTNPWLHALAHLTAIGKLMVNLTIARSSMYVVRTFVCTCAPAVALCMQNAGCTLGRF